MVGLHDASDEARDWAATTMALVCHAAYRASIRLAQEKGAFPFFQRDRYPHGAVVRALPADVRAGIEAHGIRNSHLTAIAPTGTISLLANNLSSGIEPIFGLRYHRRVLAHLDMQTLLQPYVDSAISKTINVSPGYSFEAFKRLYELAYEKGAQGVHNVPP